MLLHSQPLSLSEVCASLWPEDLAAAIVRNAAFVEDYHREGADGQCQRKNCGPFPCVVVGLLQDARTLAAHVGPVQQLALRWADARLAAEQAEKKAASRAEVEAAKDLASRLEQECVPPIGALLRARDDLAAHVSLYVSHERRDTDPELVKALWKWTKP